MKYAGLGINFEYTAPHPPHNNGRVEWNIEILYGRLHIMLNDSNSSKKICHGLWDE